MIDVVAVAKKNIGNDETDQPASPLGAPAMVHEAFVN
jgi:hypothetical protein